MMTLLQSALTGWTDYTQHGKFAAFLLLAILYLGFVLYGSSGKEANATGAAGKVFCLMEEQECFDGEGHEGKE